MDIKRTFGTDEIESLVRRLPEDVDLEFECLSYGLRELGGNVCFVEGYDGEARIVVEARGVRQSAPIGSVQSIRCDVSRSADLAQQVCAGLPLRTTVAVETRSGTVHGTFDGAGPSADVLCIDRQGTAHALPAHEVLAIRVECA